jgi:hypothetical protein
MFYVILGELRRSPWGEPIANPKKKKKMVHVTYRNINTFKSDSAYIYIRNLYLNTLGKHAKNLKFVRFFFFFFF